MAKQLTNTHLSKFCTKQYKLKFLPARGINASHHLLKAKDNKELSACKLRKLKL
jgi:hypothetical protein